MMFRLDTIVDVLLEINRMSFPGFHLDPIRSWIYFRKLFQKYSGQYFDGPLMETEFDVKHESEQPVNPLKFLLLK